MAIIEIQHLTKDYGHNRGIFDVSLQVEKGECYGFLGPNGAGKTTTIRHLMGFSKPMSGSATILGMDCFQNATELKTKMGYLPGEIAFPKGLTGWDFLNMQRKMRHVKDDTYLKELLSRFELDPGMSVDKMSLGVRRKLAVVTSFLADPEILILDEPTSGLDPIMQQTFIDFIVSEKKRGKTILLSSHIFHEVDATCDKISIIKDGKIVANFATDEFQKQHSKIYGITFKDQSSYELFKHCGYTFHTQNEKKLYQRIILKESETNRLLDDLSTLHVKDLSEIPFTLEDYFMGFYKNETTFEEVH